MTAIQTAPLADVAEVVRGVTFSKSEAADKPAEGFVPLLRAGNIQDRLILDEDLVFVPRDRVHSKQMIRKGDIVICTSSGSAEVVGKTAYANMDWNGSFGAFCAGIRVKSANADPSYVFHFLRSPHFRSWTQKSSGANIKNIRKSELDQFEIPLPPVSEQKRIASILDKADEIRRKRVRFGEETQDFVRSAYLHAVGHLNPSHGDWQPFTIDALAEDRRGAIRSGPFGSALRHGEFVDEGIAVLGIDNAVQNMFAWAERRFITPSKYEELRRYKVFPGDVIITIMGTTGRSAVVPDDIPEAITTKHLATITCNKELIHPEVLSFAIHSDPLIIRQIKSFNKGAIMDGLNLGIIRQLEINLPPMEEQLRFLRMLRKARAIETRSQTSDGSGEDLFQSLSQRAFRGEL